MYAALQRRIPQTAQWIIQLKKTPRQRGFCWRHHPESNWRWRFCRPLPYRLAMVPCINMATQRVLHSLVVWSGKQGSFFAHRASCLLTPLRTRPESKKPTAKIAALLQFLNAASIPTDKQHFANTPKMGVFAKWSGKRGSNPPPPPWQGGALPNELFPRWCLRVESNHRHRDFQSLALPTELPRQMAIRRGLEPLTSSVTGWHSNQLNYRTTLVGTTGLEPVTLCL